MAIIVAGGVALVIHERSSESLQGRSVSNSLESGRKSAQFVLPSSRRPDPYWWPRVGSESLDADEFRELVSRSQVALVASKDGEVIGFLRALTDGWRTVISRWSSSPSRTVKRDRPRPREGVMGEDRSITWVLRAGRDGVAGFYEKLGFARSAVAMERPGELPSAGGGRVASACVESDEEALQHEHSGKGYRSSPISCLGQLLTMWPPQLAFGAWGHFFAKRRMVGHI
jgi:hypothetical protein